MAYRLRKTGLFYIALLVVIALAAGPAAAAQVKMIGASKIVYTAANGEANRLQLFAVGGGLYAVRDTGATITYKPPCLIAAGYGLACPGNGGTELLSVNLKDMDDTAQVQFGVGARSTVKGGSGYDNISGGLGRNDLDAGANGGVLGGGPSNDRLHNSSGPSSMIGYGGDDTFIGASGADYMAGGGGADTITAGSGADTINTLDGDYNDMVKCGGGADTAYFDYLVIPPYYPPKINYAADAFTGCEGYPHP